MNKHMLDKWITGNYGDIESEPIAYQCRECMEYFTQDDIRIDIERDRALTEYERSGIPYDLCPECENG